MSNLNLKERIEILLTYLKVNQKEFAKKTGLSENTISHAKKGKHIPNIEFFNSIYRILPNLNAQWLYMGIGEMFNDSKSNFEGAGKKIMDKVKTFRKMISLEDCQEELEKAETEITYLKAQVDDKNKIIKLLKKS